MNSLLIIIFINNKYYEMLLGNQLRLQSVASLKWYKTTIINKLAPLRKMIYYK